MKCNKCKNQAIPSQSLCVDCQKKKDDRRKAKRERGECAYCATLVLDDDIRAEIKQTWAELIRQEMIPHRKEPNA